MTIYALVFILIALVLVIIFVTRPLFLNQVENERPVPRDDTDQKKAEYETVLEHIRELDFEFQLGKLTPAEHEEQRNLFLGQAAALRSELQLEKTSPPPQA